MFSAPRGENHVILMTWADDVDTVCTVDALNKEKRSTILTILNRKYHSRWKQSGISFPYHWRPVVVVEVIHGFYTECKIS